MSIRRLMIIGNGMATGKLLDELYRRGPKDLEITVFGEEPHGCYNRILLGRILSGGDADDIMLKPSAWYAERGVQFHSGITITKLDWKAKSLEASDGSTHKYDVVVLATGSIPFVPDVQGLRGANGRLKCGVFAFRTIEDCERMRAALRPEANVIVVGGGLLGLEAAKALCDLGAKVTVLQRADVLMNTQVDQAGGRLLRQGIENLGVTVRTGSSTAEIIGTERVTSVRLDSGEILPADLVVFAAGIRPRTDLAKEAGLPVRQGVIVDDAMATAMPGVYAVGECAEHAGRVYGIVQPIYEQCAVLAEVLTTPKPKTKYLGSKLYTRLKVAGIEVASMGVSEPEFDTDEVLQVTETRRGIYRKLVVREDRLIGAVLVGDTSAAANLIRLFDRGDPLPENRLDILASGDEASWTAGGNGNEVCNCHHVSAATLIEEIQGGCNTLASLSAKTQAGTGCGSCRGQLADLILKNKMMLAE